MISTIPFLAVQLWPALLAALVLGFGVGLSSCGLGASRTLSRFAILFWCGAIIALGAVAASGSVPGHYGLWVEIAASLLPAYAVGGALGCGLRRVLRRGGGPDESAAAQA